MENFTPWSALTGGALIGLASIILMLGIGRIAGVSGIVNGVLLNRGDKGWRIWFLVGLMLGGLLVTAAMPMPFTLRENYPIGLLIVAGLLVGFGARLGGGCTSGHGVCGLGRLSYRSLVAVVSFVLSAGVTVFVFTRHISGI